MTASKKLCICQGGSFINGYIRELQEKLGLAACLIYLLFYSFFVFLVGDAEKVIYIDVLLCFEMRLVVDDHVMTGSDCII